MLTDAVHVGVDATSWINNRGFGRFTRELVTALASRKSGFRYTLLFDRIPDGPLPPGIGVLAADTRLNLNETAVGKTSRSPGYLWRVGRMAQRAQFDLFFFPAVYSYFPIFASVPCIVCYHDTTAERFPELLFPTRLNHRLWRIKTALARFQTTRAMTVSETSARDLEEILRIPRERIDVITEAADPVFRIVDDPEVCVNARRRYEIPASASLLVYLGGMNPHKNLISLLKGMPEVLEARSDAYLAIVGDTSGKGFWDNVPELMNFVNSNPLLARHIRFTGYMPDADLVQLLNGAAALVFPSLWEGFGLPAVEAMSCGVPVLASRRGSLPEVVADAGLFFDPENPSEIADCIVRFLGDPELRRRLSNIALERSRTFTWDRAAGLAEECFRRCYADSHAVQ
jgi:alpha-1,3-rhamnosyl/mannosyltransferase